MNEGINLLDPHKETNTVAFVHRFRFMRFFTIGLLFIVSVSAVILFILVAVSPLPALQNQEKSLQQTLASSQSDVIKLTIVNERTAAIEDILKNRKQLDQIFSLIENKLDGNTTITTVQADEKSITLTVESTSLKSLDDFLNGMIGYVQQKDTFSKVTLVDLTNDETNNQYAVTVQLNLL